MQTRAARDPAFREGLFKEGVERLLAGDIDTGKIVLRDYVNAAVGFEALGSLTGKPPKSLIRMFGPSGNPMRAISSRSSAHPAARGRPPRSAYRSLMDRSPAEPHGPARNAPMRTPHSVAEGHYIDRFGGISCPIDGDCPRVSAVLYSASHVGQVVQTVRAPR